MAEITKTDKAFAAIVGTLVLLLIVVHSFKVYDRSQAEQMQIRANYEQIATEP